MPLFLREFSSQQHEKQLPYDNHSIRDDVSLSRRATNVRPNLGPGPLLHTREFDDESNTRSHDDTEDPNASMLPHASGDTAPKEKWRKSKTYKVLKGIKAGALGVVGALKGLNSKKPKEQKYTQLSRRLEQPNGGASILAKAKRAESDNWKRDLAHSLGLDANYFL